MHSDFPASSSEFLSQPAGYEPYRKTSSLDNDNGYEPYKKSKIDRSEVNNIVSGSTEEYTPYSKRSSKKSGVGMKSQTTKHSSIATDSTVLGAVTKTGPHLKNSYHSLAIPENSIISDKSLEENNDSYEPYGRRKKRGNGYLKCTENSSKRSSGNGEKCNDQLLNNNASQQTWDTYSNADSVASPASLNISESSKNTKQSDLIIAKSSDNRSEALKKLERTLQNIKSGNFPSV